MSAAPETEELESKRDTLLEKIGKIERRLSRRRRETMEQAGVDPDGDFSSFLDELFQTREGRRGFIIAHAATVFDVTIIVNMLRVAIGVKDALVHAEIVQSLAEWLHAFEKGMTTEDAWQNPLLIGNINATLQSADEWRSFAIKLDSTREEEGHQRVIGADAMRRWLVLAGISPCG